jgi:hypothetical protein
MLYRPSSFRKSAFALTTVAALAGASVLASFPANAQQAVNYRPAPDCTTVADPGKRAVCESFKRTEDANARAAAADRRGAEADKTSTAAKASLGCMDVVGKDIAAAKAKGPLTPDMKATFKARIEKCDRVSSL